MLKTWHKHLLGYLPLEIALHAILSLKALIQSFHLVELGINSYN
jgi:hypothetical protein